MKTIKRMIMYNTDGEPYFMLNKQRWYLSDTTSDGYNATMFTNAGYYVGYVLKEFEYGINDYAVLEEIRK